MGYFNSSSLWMVMFKASNSSIFLMAHILFSPCQPNLGPVWQSGQSATQVYWSPCLTWWASLGPAASHNEQGNSLTLARCSLSLLFNLLFINVIFGECWSKAQPYRKQIQFALCLWSSEPCPRTALSQTCFNHPALGIRPPSLLWLARVTGYLASNHWRTALELESKKPLVSALHAGTVSPKGKNRD